MIYYTYDLPHTDGGYMTEKAVKAVMNEVRPCQLVDFATLTDEEMDEVISAWSSGTSREYVEELLSDAVVSDGFFMDTFSLIYFQSGRAYAEEIRKLIREQFVATRQPTSLNPLGLSLAHQLEANINTVIKKEGLEIAA